MTKYLVIQEKGKPELNQKVLNDATVSGYKFVGVIPKEKPELILEKQKD